MITFIAIAIVWIAISTIFVLILRAGEKAGIDTGLHNKARWVVTFIFAPFLVFQILLQALIKKLNLKIGDNE